MDERSERSLMKVTHRFETLLKIEHGSLKIGEAAMLLNLSSRQVKRLRRRVDRDGIKGLFYKRVHKSPLCVDAEVVRKILSLRRECYRKYNLLHFRDVLKTRHEIHHSHEFYRRLFLKNGLYEPKVKRRAQKRHRKRFEAPSAGILVQRDTSIHLWVSGSKKPWKLILDLDDHSRKILGCCFSEHDDVLSNMSVAWETMSTHGVPVAYYMDNNPIYNPIRRLPKQYEFYRYRQVDQDVRETLPQFKRALLELGIQCIHSTPYQPQGKGKIERLFRFMQDRLVQELVSAKVTTIAEANRYLKKWVEWYNNCHVHSTTRMIPQERYERSNSFRKLPKNANLNEIFCLKYDRKVKADNTFSFEGRTYQIQKNKYRISYAKAEIEVRIYLSRKLKVFYKGHSIGMFEYKPYDNNKLRLGGDILTLKQG